MASLFPTPASRFFFQASLVITLLLITACGSDVTTTGTGGAGATSSGYGGYGASPAHPMCSEQPAPFEGCEVECAATEYCRDDTLHCGNLEYYGHCEERPADCPAAGEPVCGCDDQIYNSSCEAAQAGVDVSIAGNCPPPDGTTRCGMHFCDIGSEYCEQSCCGGPMGANYFYFDCLALPAACAGTPTCMCLAQNGVLTQDDGCSQCEPGALIVTKAEEVE